MPFTTVHKTQGMDLMGEYVFMMNGIAAICFNCTKLLIKGSV